MTDATKRKGGVTVDPPLHVKSKRHADGMFYLEVGPFLHPHQSGKVQSEIKDMLGVEPSANQCDGCMAGMPVENGIHRNNDTGHGHMACTAQKY